MGCRAQIMWPLIAGWFLVALLVVFSQPVRVFGAGATRSLEKVPRQSAPISPSVPNASAPFILALDPGHGGRDTGSRGPGPILEKDFTLRISKLIAMRLRLRPEIKIVLTRESDAEISAVRRAAIANHSGASLFLSIQADASWRPNARGSSILVAAPQRPPRVEGEVPDALSLRWQRGQNVHLARSRRFARGLQKRFASAGERRKPPIRSLLLRTLEGARMPAAYISLGVISTPEESARLREMKEDDPYLIAIVAEVIRYAGLLEKVFIPMPAVSTPGADPPRNTLNQLSMPGEEKKSGSSTGGGDGR